MKIERERGNLMLTKTRYVSYYMFWEQMEKREAINKWDTDLAAGVYTEVENGELVMAVRKNTELNEKSGVGLSAKTTESRGIADGSAFAAEKRKLRTNQFDAHDEQFKHVGGKAFKHGAASAQKADRDGDGKASLLRRLQGESMDEALKQANYGYDSDDSVPTTQDRRRLAASEVAESDARSSAGGEDLSSLKWPRTGGIQPLSLPGDTMVAPSPRSPKGSEGGRGSAKSKDSQATLRGPQQPFESISERKHDLRARIQAALAALVGGKNSLKVKIESGAAKVPEAQHADFEEMPAYIIARIDVLATELEASKKQVDALCRENTCETCAKVEDVLSRAKDMIDINGPQMSESQKFVVEEINKDRRRVQMAFRYQVSKVIHVPTLSF